MRRWEHHRTRSKVALLLLINLLALLGGKYTALITIVKIELFGEAIAFAKAPKKKLPKPHLGRAQRDHPPPPPTALTGNARSPAALLHVIRHGETLTEIAASYGISVEALRHANRLSDANHLIIGETLRLPLAKGFQESAEVRYPRQSHDLIVMLGGQRPMERRPQAPVNTSHAFLWPVEGPLTSPFGERDHVMGGSGTQFHAGIDISVPTGTPVQAAQAGIVVFAGYNGAYGKAVKIDHRHGFSTLYAHNSRLLVHVGQSVRAGQVICLSGSTGRSTGPHLHFEVHKDGSPIDPLPHLD